MRCARCRTALLGALLAGPHDFRRGLGWEDPPACAGGSDWTLTYEPSARAERLLRDARLGRRACARGSFITREVRAWRIALRSGR